MTECKDCIGKNGNECCKDVYIVLNPEELHLFKNHNGFRKHDLGGLFYSSKQCPYLNQDKKCAIHESKPLYCRYYPIFITGKVFVDNICPLHALKEYQFHEELKEDLKRIQEKYPIYKEEWFWTDIKEKYHF